MLLGSAEFVQQYSKQLQKVTHDLLLDLHVSGVGQCDQIDLHVHEEAPAIPIYELLEFVEHGVYSAAVVRRRLLFGLYAQEVLVEVADWKRIRGHVHLEGGSQSLR